MVFIRPRPEMMLGQMRLGGGMYGGNEPTLEADGRNLRDAIAQNRAPSQADATSVSESEEKL
jgi:hypothetical protein